VEAVVTLHTERTGSANKPTLVLSHALGFSTTMWDELIPFISQHFNILRYDHRGHGQSPAHHTPYSIWHMVDDTANLLKSQGLSKVIFAGLSMGGMIGQGLAAKYPELVEQLIIANTAGAYPLAFREVFLQRGVLVAEKGMDAVADAAMERWFSASFRAAQNPLIAKTRATYLSNDTRSQSQAISAVAHIDFRADWAAITCPTLIIASDEDLATPPALAEQILAGLVNSPRKQITPVNGVGHLSVIEKPEAFANAILNFVQ
jgi:3-oxoadipate enol-lactonase